MALAKLNLNRLDDSGLFLVVRLGSVSDEVGAPTMSRSRVKDPLTIGQNMWQELALAFCLMLVIEGIIPFVAPQQWRNLLRSIEQIDDGTLRAVGLVSMLVGTFALFFIN